MTIAKKKRLKLSDATKNFIEKNLTAEVIKKIFRMDQVKEIKYDQFNYLKNDVYTVPTIDDVFNFYECLEDKRVVTNKEASDFAEEKGFLFHEVSAKTGDEVQELFNNVIFPEMARKFNIGDEEGEPKNEQEEGGDKKVKLNQNNEELKKKGGCCGGGKNKQKKVEQNVPDSEGAAN